MSKNNLSPIYGKTKTGLIPLKVLSIAGKRKLSRLSILGISLPLFLLFFLIFLILLNCTSSNPSISSTPEVEAKEEDLGETCSLSTDTSTDTPCVIQLPNIVFDSSERFSGRVPDQSGKYLVRIDASAVFPPATNISYRILSGNPTYDYRWTSPTGIKRSIRLSGYHINSEGKLYTKDVWLLGRNSALYDDANERAIFRAINGSGRSGGDWTWVTWRGRCPILGSGVHDCTNLHNYQFDYTFNRTDTDVLVIEVKNRDTGEQREITVHINPSPDSSPSPRRVSSDEPITPAPSTGLSCFSASAERINNCTQNLPLVVRENAERFWWINQPDNYFVRVDASNAFPASNRLSYTILSGNPTYTYEKTLSSGIKQIIDLAAYGINSEGEIYPKDVWLLGRNQNIYARERDQLESVHRSFAIDRSLCRRILNSRNIDCSGLHNFSMNYTFGKTEADNLVVRVEDRDTQVKRDITVTINPHPHAVSLASQCASNDDLQEWACINAAPLIPERQFTTTSAMRNSLPTTLARHRSKYDLVAAVEFNSFDEMENMFDVPMSFRTSLEVRITNGKLQLLINPVPTSNGRCVYSKNPWVDSTGVFEPGAGYLEYKVTKYPKISAVGGNVIMWSRYGAGHGAFWLAPPNRVWRSNGRTSVTRSDIGRIGYAEIDFLERWGYFSYPYFVVHTYPLTDDRYPVVRERPTIGGLPIHSSTIPKAHYYKSWGAGSSNNDTTGANTYSITYGMEISPGRSRAGRTVNFFKNGVRFDSGSGRGAFDYVNGGAFRIRTISDLGIGAKRCSTLPPTMIEMDHIRYYRPRDGY